MLHRAPGPVGAERPGCDDGDLDAKRLYFLRQRFRDALQRELASVIDADAWEPREPTHRRDVDDMARTLLAHVRQHRLHNRHGAEHVDLELAAHLIETYLLDGSFEPIARVIDSDINGAMPFGNRVDSIMHAGFVGDVEHDRDGASRGQALERRP